MTRLVIFDQQRHKLNMHLPLDYPRINQFPEWFTARSGARYEVILADGTAEPHTGSELTGGLPIRLTPGNELRLRVVER